MNRRQWLQTIMVAGLSAPEAGSQGNGFLLFERQLPRIFSLIDQDGKPFGPERLKNRSGKPKITVLGFGFTECGAICPFSMQAMNRLNASIPDKENVQIAIVSVDPEHDTVAVNKNYLNQKWKGDKNCFYLTSPDGKISDGYRNFYKQITGKDFNKREHGPVFYVLAGNKVVGGANFGQTDALVVGIQLAQKKLLERTNQKN